MTQGSYAVGFLFLALVCAPPSVCLAQGTGSQGNAQTGSKPGDTNSQEARKDKEDHSELGAPVDPNTFILGAEDIIQVRVWREPDVSGEFAIRPDGKFTMPLIGEVTASGLTPKQLTAHVTEKLTKFINSPEVFIMVREVRSKKYLVSGEVNRPGSYPLVTPTTVVEAIVSAGGFRDFANRKKIVIMRGTERIKFNYVDVIKGKGNGLNMKVEPGDHIYVP
ncbi:MAG: polysaccharide biosynthesis/export family protein [Bryobacterales bacterium]|nr:polysaccharide biosynthesis/export family protein [Bryobacterales bacterium]